MPIFHPRYKREFFQDPAKNRVGPQTRSDLLLSGRGESFKGFISFPCPPRAGWEAMVLCMYLMPFFTLSVEWVATILEGEGESH